MAFRSAVAWQNRPTCSANARPRIAIRDETTAPCRPTGGGRCVCIGDRRTGQPARDRASSRTICRVRDAYAGPHRATGRRRQIGQLMTEPGQPVERARSSPGLTRISNTMRPRPPATRGTIFQVDRLPGCRLHKPARCRRRALRRDCRHRWPASQAWLSTWDRADSSTRRRLTIVPPQQTRPKQPGPRPHRSPQPFRRQLCAAAANVATGSAGRAAGRVYAQALNGQRQRHPVGAFRHGWPRRAGAVAEDPAEQTTAGRYTHGAGSRPAPQAPGQFWWAVPRADLARPARGQDVGNQAAPTGRPATPAARSSTPERGGRSRSVPPPVRQDRHAGVRRPSALAWGLAGCRPVGGGQQSTTAGVRRGTMGADAFYNGRKEPAGDFTNGLASLYLLRASRVFRGTPGWRAAWRV